MAKVYEGNEPYIFISYSHKDADEAIMAIEALQSKGFRVWFDGGIEAGSEWPQYIAGHIDGCACVVNFISKNYDDSFNCQRELVYALALKKPFLSIYLVKDESELSSGLVMQLGLNQALWKYKFSKNRDYLNAICDAKILTPCKSDDPLWDLVEHEIDRMYIYLPSKYKIGTGKEGVVSFYCHDEYVGAHVARLEPYQYPELAKGCGLECVKKVAVKVLELEKAECGDIEYFEDLPYFLCLVKEGSIFWKCMVVIYRDGSSYRLYLFNCPRRTFDQNFDEFKRYATAVRIEELDEEDAIFSSSLLKFGEDETDFESGEEVKYDFDEISLYLPNNYKISSEEEDQISFENNDDFIAGGIFKLSFEDYPEVGATKDFGQVRDLITDTVGLPESISCGEVEYFGGVPYFTCVDSSDDEITVKFLLAMYRTQKNMYVYAFSGWSVTIIAKFEEIKKYISAVVVNESEDLVKHELEGMNIYLPKEFVADENSREDYSFSDDTEAAFAAISMVKFEDDPILKRSSNPEYAKEIAIETLDMAEFECSEIKYLDKTPYFTCEFEEDGERICGFVAMFRTGSAACFYAFAYSPRLGKYTEEDIKKFVGRVEIP